MHREPVSPSIRGIERVERFEPVPANVRAARDVIAARLEDEGFSGDTDTVLLLVSELVTNAVRHAVTPFEVVVEVEGPSVRVSVIDGDGEHAPKIRHPSLDDTNGRGLLIVDQLASSWGSHRVGAREKAVWFTLS